jgi:hypothetical protein
MPNRLPPPRKRIELARLALVALAIVLGLIGAVVMAVTNTQPDAQTWPADLDRSDVTPGVAANHE